MIQSRPHVCLVSLLISYFRSQFHFKSLLQLNLKGFYIQGHVTVSRVVLVVFVYSDARCCRLTQSSSIRCRIQHESSRNSKMRGDRWADGEQGRWVPWDVSHVLLYNQGILKEGTSHPRCSNEPCGLLPRGDGNLQSLRTTVHKEWTKLMWDGAFKSPSLQTKITVGLSTLTCLQTWDKSINFSFSLLSFLENVYWNTHFCKSVVCDVTEGTGHFPRLVTRWDKTEFLLCPLRPPLQFLSPCKNV